MAGVAASGSIAAPIFFDNFNAENGGVANSGTLNYTGFANWDVTDGTVDLIGNGYFEFFGGQQGLYVDLDGSTGNAGIMSTKSSFTFDSSKEYKLTFKLAGNQRGGSDTVMIDIGVGSLLADTIMLNANDPLQTYTYTFLGDDSNGKLIFENLGGDNVGALLDDVTLTVIPLPSASVLAGLGLAAVATRRSRQSV